MKTQIKIEGDRVAIKKENRQKQGKNMKTLSLKNSIQYKRVLQKRNRKKQSGEGGEEKSNKEIKVEESFADETSLIKPWLLDRRESEICFESVVKKIDYDSLELQLYKSQITDYHKLIETVNIWSCNAGFLVKLKRSPKVNADGSQTLRLYCQSYKKSDAHSCPFAMSFKQCEKTGCWLMYQEYNDNSMRHSHRLEKRRHDSIRDYIQDYKQKVNNLGNLKDMIYSKFGFDYSLKEMNYLKGKWTGEAVVVEKENNSESECLNLIKTLKKTLATDLGDCLEIEFDPNEKNNLQYLFYSTAKMKEQYMKCSDMIFINKRFS